MIDRMPVRLLATATLVALTLDPPAHGQQAQPPVFRTGVELVMVDVQVIDRKGQPITGLKPEQFEVQIDGKRRKVVSAQLIDAASGTVHPQSAPQPEGAAPSKPIDAGTLYIVAVDQGSFRALNAPSAIHALNEFIKRLSPNDYMGIVAYPPPGIVIDPTRDRAVLTAAVPKVVGFTNVPQPRRFQYSLSDALDATSRDTEARSRAIQRNCPPNDMACPVQLEMEMAEVVTALEAQSVRSLDGMRGVIRMAQSIEGRRKTLVVISAGVPTGDRTGGRLYMRTHASEVGREAAAAGLLLYTLHLNNSFLDAFSPQAPSVSQTLMRETGIYARGLDVFNGAAGGTLMEVNTGSDFAIERMMRETSAYYLLGVEPEAADRDGERHLIRVRVNQRGSSIRNRPSVVIPKPSS
jgi:VWFA-related protein